VVDGVIKRALDYHNSCDFTGNNTLTIGATTYFSFDEFRISKKANYSFNLQDEVSGRPTLTSVSIPDEGTVGTPAYNLNFSVSDPDGINSEETRVFLNGIEVLVSETSKFTSGLISDFSANLDLNNGANDIRIKTQDMKGNDEVFTQTVYMFAEQGSGEEYIADSNTVFLYHFNEASGNFNDSGNSGVSIPSSSWTRTAGVLNGAASNYSASANNNYGAINANDGWTFEFWGRITSTNTINVFVGTGIQFNIASYALQLVHQAGGGTHTQVSNIKNDNQWHHYAIVADPNHPLKNLYLHVDGKVVYSVRNSNRFLISNFTGGLGYTLYNSSLDEVRFSKIPRYEMVSTAQ
jgi:hypothetical protein